MCAGSHAQSPGQPLGSGVTAAAARELGLVASTPVASSLIDADAGWLGTVLCHDVDSVTVAEAEGEGGSDRRARMVGVEDARRAIGSRAALVCGTSVSLFWHAPRRLPVPGLWGPFPDAIIRDFHQLAGGLNAAGRLVCS